MDYVRDGLSKLNVTITDASMSDEGGYEAQALYIMGSLTSTSSATFSVTVTTPTIGNATYMHILIPILIFSEVNKIKMC